LLPNHRRTFSVGEAIVIGDNIKLTVWAIKGDTVKLSIKAPRTVPVIRLELLAKGEDKVPQPGPVEPPANRGGHGAIYL